MHVDMNDFVQSAVVCLAQPATKRPSTLRNWQAGPKRLGPSCRHGPVRLTSSTHATNTWALPRASLERLARVVTGCSHGRCSPHRQDGCGSVNHVPREMNRTKEELSPQTHVCATTASTDSLYTVNTGTASSTDAVFDVQLRAWDGLMRPLLGLPHARYWSV